MDSSSCISLASGSSSSLDHQPQEFPVITSYGRSSLSSMSSDGVSLLHGEDENNNSSKESLSNVCPLSARCLLGSEAAEIVELTSVQMEVTIRLMEAERRRLILLTQELEMVMTDPRTSKADVNILQAKIERIQHKYLNLEEEYRVYSTGAFIRRVLLSCKPTRSQPAIGVKQTSKRRPSIFGTVTQEDSPPAPAIRQRRSSVGPQMMSLSQMFGSHSGYVAGDNNNSPDVDPHRDALIFENGNLHSGPLEALVQHLVPTSDYNPDRTYTFSFLLSSRLFIRPSELLADVCKLCVLQQNLVLDKLDNMKRSRSNKFGPHIVNLLNEWTDMFPYDFREEGMMRQLRDITQRVVATYPELRKDINNLSYSLVTKLTNLKSYEEKLARIEAEEQLRGKNQVIATTDIIEMCPSPLVLAQQLTHVELERLSMIGPEEFIQAFSKERTSSDKINYQDMKSTHNLESYVQWFNRLSYLVASEITSHIKKKNRVRVVEYFIDVAKECINIGNFNSLMAIIAAMNLSPISRLKRMWSKVNKDKLKILEHQMDPSNNFGSYRSCLKAAMWRSEGAAEDREKIVVPFFSLFVKDLYFLNEGCSSRQEDGSINFHKCWQMAKQISDLVAWQQVECPFDKCPSVLHYVLTTPVYKETMLSLASYECEPPETSFDREKYKQLKSQTPVSPL